MATNPMHQFEVYRIGPEIKVGAIDLSFTNASLFMVISSLAILIIFNLVISRKAENTANEKSEWEKIKDFGKKINKKSKK